MQKYAYVNIKTTLSLDDNAHDTNDDAMKARIRELASWGSSGYRIVARDEIESAGTRAIYETLQRTSD